MDAPDRENLTKFMGITIEQIDRLTEMCELNAKAIETAVLKATVHQAATEALVSMLATAATTKEPLLPETLSAGLDILLGRLPSNEDVEFLAGVRKQFHLLIADARSVADKINSASHES